MQTTFSHLFVYNTLIHSLHLHHCVCPPLHLLQTPHPRRRGAVALRVHLVHCVCFGTAPSPPLLPLLLPKAICFCSTRSEQSLGFRVWVPKDAEVRLRGLSLPECHGTRSEQTAEFRESKRERESESERERERERE
jgi:hypothetical protein